MAALNGIGGGGVKNATVNAQPLKGTGVCVVIPFFLDVRFEDAPAGVTQDFSTFLLVLDLIFLARRIQQSISLVDREVDIVYPRINRFPLVGHVFVFSNKKYQVV